MRICWYNWLKLISKSYFQKRSWIQFCVYKLCMIRLSLCASLLHRKLYCKIPIADNGKHLKNLLMYKGRLFFSILTVASSYIHKCCQSAKISQLFKIEVGSCKSNTSLCIPISKISPNEGKNSFSFLYSVHLPLCSDVRAYLVSESDIILRWRINPRGQRRIPALMRKCCANQ